MNINRGVLLLNATYEPLRVVSLWRAVCMIVGDQALIEHEADDEGPIRSQHLSIPCPSVIRLRHYVHVPYKTRTRLNTRTVVARDNKECCYCGGKADTIDHVIPTSRGGQHVWTNVVAACGRCNGYKSDKLLEEIGWEMRYQPTIPPPHHWVTVSRTERDVWNQYVPELTS